MGLSDFILSARAMFGSRERGHWRHGKICKGSQTPLLNISDDTRTGLCRVCNATGLKATKAGISWKHQNRGTRLTRRAFYSKVKSPRQHRDMKRYMEAQQNAQTA